MPNITARTAARSKASHRCPPEMLTICVPNFSPTPDKVEELTMIPAAAQAIAVTTVALAAASQTERIFSAPGRLLFFRKLTMNRPTIDQKQAVVAV